MLSIFFNRKRNVSFLHWSHVLFFHFLRLNLIQWTTTKILISFYPFSRRSSGKCQRWRAATDQWRSSLPGLFTKTFFFCLIFEKGSANGYAWFLFLVRAVPQWTATRRSLLPRCLTTFWPRSITPNTVSPATRRTRPQTTVDGCRSEKYIR